MMNIHNPKYPIYELSLIFPAVIIGTNAGYSSSGYSHTYVGYEAGYAHGGNDNVAIGREALKTAGAGGSNTIVGGRYAGDAISTGTNNAALGQSALSNLIPKV